MVLGGGAIGFGSALVLAMQGAGEVVLVEPNPERRDEAARGLSRARCRAPDEAEGPTAPS